MTGLKVLYALSIALILGIPLSLIVIITKEFSSFLESVCEYSTMVKQKLYKYTMSLLNE